MGTIRLLSGENLYMYEFIRPLLFRLDPERSHHLALASLNLAHRLGLSSFLFPSPLSTPYSCFGLTFSNRVGIAAGFDKDAEYIDALAALGVGFIEIGTITPKPQPGNPRPRLFRLPQEKAIINRMGFGSKGINYMVEQLEKTHYRGILGISIGKNRATPNEQAIQDYVEGFSRLWKYASYIAVNVSSPNTPGLRDLQQADYLDQLLHSLKTEQISVFQSHQKYVPLVIKISPDNSRESLKDIANVLLQHRIDGVILTNTTISREGLTSTRYANEIGGLSGQPLQTISMQTLQQFHPLLKGKIPIIASGGIMDVNSAQEKISAGASLLQLYTGLIYRGPRLIKEIISSFAQ